MNSEILDLAKTKISDLLQEALEKEYITKDEHEAMDPTDKKPGKFYETFKVHKQHKPGETPPERPIISGSGSITENISIFVEHYLKDLAVKHPSYLQDTPDFLRFIEDIKAEGPLPANTILVSIDVSGLYTNIPQDEGLEVVDEALDTKDLPFPKDFLVKLLELTLKYNIFEFDSELFLQSIGTAMGIRPAPSYANLFMAKIDQLAINLAHRFGEGIHPIKAWKRFLDDIYILWTGSSKKLHDFLDELNQTHPTIKFTVSHTTPEMDDQPCKCQPTSTLAFLDTATSIVNQSISVDLYKKPTDRCQYLLTSSCHPPHITQNIPFSLAYRIIRICSETENRDQRLDELKAMLISRDYKPNLVDAAIKKAKAIPRERALLRVEKKMNHRRPVFSVEYHPSLPSISAILKKHWRVMTDDPHLKEIFPLPPMVAYRRPPNLKDKLVRAKVPPTNTRPKRQTQGMKRCRYNCLTCPYVQPGKMVAATATPFKTDIQSAVDCQSSNLVYCINCDKCREQYVGETERTLSQRFAEHRGYVRNKKLEKATGAHFNLPGHSMADMKITIIEKIMSDDPQMRKLRESHFIKQFGTRYKGMNKIN